MDVAEAQLACVDAVQTIAVAAGKGSEDVRRILFNRGARKLVREALGRHSERVPPIRFVGYRAMKHLPIHRGGGRSDVSSRRRGIAAK